MFAFNPRQLGFASKLNPTRKLAIEVLESRDQPSITGSIHFNAETFDNQYSPAIANSVSGISVAVWTTNFWGDQDIHARRYNTKTNVMIGSEIHIESGSKWDNAPDVAIDNAGNFVVVYNSRATESSSDQRDIFARRFNTLGKMVGGKISVATTSANEFGPKIAMTGNGQFVVTYTTDVSANNKNVTAKMYDNKGLPLKTIQVANSSAVENAPAIARTRSSKGDFAISYVERQKDVVLKRYSKSGALLGQQYVANTSATEFAPSIAMDENSDIVVTYTKRITTTNHDIWARQISSTGVMDAPISVGTSKEDETFSTVAMHPTDGQFAVSYLRFYTASAFYKGWIAEFESSGDLYRRGVWTGSDSLSSNAAPRISAGFPMPWSHGNAIYFIAFVEIDNPVWPDEMGGIFAAIGWMDF